jgi:choline monooxygenase
MLRSRAISTTRNDTGVEMEMAGQQGFPDAQAAERSPPLATAYQMPGSWYADPRVHAIDLERILAATWQYVGPASSVASPGACVTTEVAGRGIVVVRGTDGDLRAFYNVCRHRGGPLAKQDCTIDRFQCAYHGWVYALDGRLVGTPQFKGAEGFRREDFGLLPVAVGVWHGMVFVNCAAEPPALATVMAGVAEDLAPIDLDSKTFVARDVYPVAADWKAYVDNYLEAYHLPAVHPLYFRTVDYKTYRYELRCWYSVQKVPLSDDAGYYAELREPGQAVRDATYLWAWPNLTFNVLPGRVQVNHVRPTGLGTCEVVFDYYYDAADDPAVQALIAEDRAASTRIQAEDADICQRVQRNLASGVYRPGRLVPEQELAVHHFQDLIRGVYRDHLQASGATRRAAGGVG